MSGVEQVRKSRRIAITWQETALGSTVKTVRHPGGPPKSRCDAWASQAQLDRNNIFWLWHERAVENYITGGTVMPSTWSVRISSRRTTAAVASRNRLRLSSASLRIGWRW